MALQFTDDVGYWKGRAEEARQVLSEEREACAKVADMEAIQAIGCNPVFVTHLPSLKDYATAHHCTCSCQDRSRGVGILHAPSVHRS